MKRLLLAAIVTLCLAPAAPAQDEARYVNEYTYLVGAIDLKKFDPDALFGRLDKLGHPREEIEPVRKLAKQLRDQALDAGARNVVFTLSLADNPIDGPVAVIPVPVEGAARALRQTLDKVPGMTAEVRNGVILFGTKAAVERAKATKPRAVPEVGKALAAVEGLPVRIAFVAPPALKKVVGELAPTLPKELGGGSSSALLGGVKWAALGFDFAGKAQVKLVVQAENAASARKLDDVIGRALDLAPKHEQLARLPEVVKALELLRPKLDGDRLLIDLDEQAATSLLLPTFKQARGQEARGESLDRLKQIGLAMHNYYDRNKFLPAQASYAGKKPLLSWRVHLLPYLGETKLYEQFKLDEPWDSAHNKKLIAQMPKVYRSPFSVKAHAEGKTTYLVPAGPGLVFDGPKKMKLAQVADGTANTVFAVDADEDRAVFWTQPADLKVDRKNVKAGLSGKAADGILVLLGDASARVIRRDVSAESLWLLFDPNDGMPIPEDAWR